ncbi:hypothetical protein DFH08DRAFT_957827 [Mycena albidolilacea]|uniref:Uncharacterized protein n=1 Tax=Mycena albidolilacea TaxID=1033008 RepID=A0AAD7A7X0_9AGAR|nr:hypothetical protein DFH08DRAFT_957827 [Mycena albidolilacea]
MGPYSNTVDTTNVHSILSGLYIAMAEAFLYGAYAVMFAFYLHVLHTKRIKTRFLSVMTISLFILCTAHFTLVLASTAVLDQTNGYSVIDADDPSSMVFRLNFAANVIYVTSNVIADSIFIFRCYAIWNFDRRITILPILSTAVFCVVGFFDSNRSIVVSRSMFNAAVGTSVFTTFMLMGLSAGRILWLAWTAKQVLGRTMTTRYRTVCVMILESGAVYCAGGIIYIILALHQPSDEPIGSDFARKNGAILGQLVGIAPTIIAVRAGLEKDVEVPEDPQHVKTVRDIQFPVTRSIQSQTLYLRPESDQGSAMAEEV